MKQWKKCSGCGGVLFDYDKAPYCSDCRKFMPVMMKYDAFMANYKAMVDYDSKKVGKYERGGRFQGEAETAP